MADTKDTGMTKNTFVPFYEEAAQIYMSLKLSKDGESRKEDTEVLKGMYEEEKMKNVGLKVRRRVFGRKDDNGDDGSGP